jgi:hemerythrin
MFPPSSGLGQNTSRLNIKLAQAGIRAGAPGKGYFSIIMSVLSRLSGISFHLSDLDESFPKFVGQLEKLQQAVLNHEEGPPVVQSFHETGLLALQIFRREEEAMELCRDKGVTAHKAAHRKFLSNLTNAQTRFQAEGPSVALAQDLRTELVDWMVDHHRLMNAGMGKVVRDMVERSIRHHQESSAQGGSSAS